MLKSYSLDAQCAGGHQNLGKKELKKAPLNQFVRADTMLYDQCDDYAFIPK